MLYNNNDSPKELYERMLINTKLKERYEFIRIFSFPMRYSPILKRDRNHVGKQWHRRQIRAFQLILNATHGIVSHKPNFFYRAFGANVESFYRILSMPFRYIINRDLFEKVIPESFLVWHENFQLLDESEKMTLLDLLENKVAIDSCNVSSPLESILLHYTNDSSEVVPKNQYNKEREEFFKRIYPLKSGGMI